MSEPIFDDSTEAVYARLPEHFRQSDVAQDYALKKYLTGICPTINNIQKLIERFDYIPPQDGGLPGTTSDLTDPRTADIQWLPWLGQLLGVKLKSRVVDETTRNEVLNASNGYLAGTDAAIISAVQAELVGTKSVNLKKRSTSAGAGGPWDLLIQTLQSETLMNLLPANIVVPSSARNFPLYSVPDNFLGRVSLTIEEDDKFYKKRALRFRAVPETSGIGSEPGDIDDGYGEDDFGLEAFGTGDDEDTAPSEYYFYSPYYFSLDASDPLTSMVDISYESGTNDTVTVTAGIKVYSSSSNDFNNLTDLNVMIGQSNVSFNRGEMKRIIGRTENLPANGTVGRWLVRFQNVGQNAIIDTGHFGARKEVNTDWVPRSADPIKAVVDRGAKPAGLKLWHSYSTSSWDALENGGATTWDDLEAQPDWVRVEESNGT